jgi:hypothetical protein
MYRTLYDRFYNPKRSVTTKMSSAFQAKIMDLANSTKHERIRRNKREKAKLDLIDKGLRTSPKLRAVETEEEHFEAITS